MKKIKTLLTACLLIAVIAMLSLCVNAASRPTIKSTTYTYTSYETVGGGIIFKALKGDVIQSIKSSNQAVATAKAGAFGNTKNVTVYPKKQGTTTISFQVKRSGKTYQLKTCLKVVDGRIFKTFKIGTKNYISLGSIGKKGRLPLGSRAIKGKLNVVPTAQWQIKAIYLMDETTGKIIRTVKNGSTITLNQKQSLLFDICNIKSKDRFSKLTYYISSTRD